MIRVPAVEHGQFEAAPGAGSDSETCSCAQVTASLGGTLRLGGHIVFRMVNFEVNLSPGLKSGGLAGRASHDSSACNDAIGELVKQRGDDRVDFGLGRGERFATSLTGIPANSAPLGFFHPGDFMQKPAARDFCTFLLPHLVSKRALFNVNSQR